MKKNTSKTKHKMTKYKAFILARNDHNPNIEQKSPKGTKRIRRRYTTQNETKQNK